MKIGLSGFTNFRYLEREDIHGYWSINLYFKDGRLLDSMQNKDISLWLTL